MARAAIILAAGMGTRMKSAMPKVMHRVAGLPMLGHVIAAAKAAGVERIVVVTSADGEAVREFAAAQGAASVIQDKQLGTGHAAACAADALKDFSGAIITTYGDMPLVTRRHLRSLLRRARKNRHGDCRVPLAGARPMAA